MTHAKHNEDACVFLLENKRFNDWVITTAFYSALHYAQCELFPFKENEIEYKTFDKYFNLTIQKFNIRQSKHATTKNLVNKNLKKSSSYYRWLFDASMSARYNNYNVSNEKASTAKKYLDLFKHNFPEKIANETATAVKA